MAEEQPGELVTKNNQLTAFLTVLEGGLRVLYLEGEPRQEQKFIRWALDSSPDIDLDFQWFPSRLRKDWPVFLGDTFEKGNYDAYILGDCDSAALGEENLKQLAAEVERGKGLITLGGYHSFGPGGYRNTPLRDVLAGRNGPPGAAGFRTSRRAAVALSRARCRCCPPGRIRSPCWPPPRRTRRCGGTAPLKGANRWAGVKEIPGVQVLAETPDDESAAGGRRIRCRTRAGLRRRFDLAMVAARPQTHASPVLAPSRALARTPRRPDPQRRLDRPAPTPLCRRQPSHLHDRSADRDGRCDSRRSLDGHLDRPRTAIPPPSDSPTRARNIAGTIDRLTQPGSYQIKAVGHRLRPANRSDLRHQFRSDGPGRRAE